MTSPKSNIAFVFRSPAKGGFSIERVFNGHIIQRENWGDRVVIGKGALAALGSIWRLWKYDLVHVTGDIHWVVTLMPLKRSVLTIHDLGRYEELKGLRRLCYYIWWILLPVLFANRITVVSEYTRGRLTLVCPWARKKINVVHNSVSPDYVPTRRYANGTPTVLQLGTAPHKNAELTVKSLRGSGVKLVLLGKKRKSLLEELEESSVAHEWHSAVTAKEVIELYRQSDVVVFVSRHEGFGMPIIEAQSIGRPVITSRCASLPEIGGDSVIYVDVNDDNQLRIEIETLLTSGDTWNTQVQKGFKNAARFDAKGLAQDLHDIHQNVLRQNRFRCQST